MSESASMNAETKAIARAVTVFVLIVALFSAVGAYFAYNTLLKAERLAVESRFALTARRVAATVERASSVGVALQEQITLPELLSRESSVDPAIRRMDVLDDVGRTVFSSDPSSTDREGLTNGSDAASERSVAVIAPIRNDLGATVGTVIVRYSSSLLETLTQQLGHALKQSALIAMGVGGLVTLLGSLWVVRAAQGRRRLPAGALAGRRIDLFDFGFRGALSIVAGLALTVSLAMVGWTGLQIGQRDIVPELVRKAQSVARASSALIEYALELNIPVDALQGVDVHFQDVRSSNPEIAGMALRVAGRTVAASDSGQTDDRDQMQVQSVRHEGADAGQVEVRLDGRVVANQLRATMIDIAFLGVVSLLIALELMALLVGAKASRELIQIEERLSALRRTEERQTQVPRPPEAVQAVRSPLFLFMMAEELMRSFLPGHARSLVQAGSAQADLLGSLPLVVFLAVVALLQIPLTVASRRLGRMEGFALGGAVASVGYVIGAYTDSLAVFTVSRLLSAVGFSLVFVSAQGQVIDASSTRDRASSLAIFIRAILVAGLCGPPLGGMFADRWGIRVTLLICAVLSLLAMLAATLSLPRRKPTTAAGIDFGLTDLRDAWKTPGVRGMLLGCAFPAKLILTGLCFYLVPLGLQKQGYSSAEIGRLLMIYPLMMVVAVPGFATLADRLGQRREFVIAGGLVAGTCTLIMLFSTAPWWVAVMLLLLGIGQAMSITPQSAMMADLASNMNGKQVASVMGLFRLVERSGSAVGPALGAMLLGGLGFGAALGSFGVVVIAGSLAFALTSKAAAR